MPNLRRRLAINPDFPEAHKNLGLALLRVHGHVSEAIAQLEAGLKSNPDDAEAHNDLGAVLGGVAGRLPDAIKHFESAIRIKPDYAEAHFNLGRALMTIGGRNREARAQFEAVRRLRPDWELIVSPSWTFFSLRIMDDVPEFIGKQMSLLQSAPAVSNRCLQPESRL